MSTFGILDDDFVLDGHPYRVLSGAIHYFRVHPELWADRIHKAKLMGLNTIETYVPWNFHAPQPNVWLDAGQRDLSRFLGLIADEGMKAVVRPGPYICAEWDNGGLPAWLFTDPEVGIRRSEPRFLAAVSDYLRRVMSIVAPLQIDRGGPVILVQVENEYGAYGSDKDYLRQLTAIIRKSGITLPLITVDQPIDDMLENGSLPELHRTASFGSRPLERLEALRRHQPTGPLMCSEFWDGWFDHWGAHHHTTSGEQSAADLDALLAAGASVNIYMFHGGSNFGFTNGANDKGVYQPLTTSYDYDAPLDEAGNPTAKYWAFREVLGKYSTLSEEVPPEAAPAPEFTLDLDRSASMWSLAAKLGDWSWTDELPTLDELGHFTGFALYSTEVDLREPAVLSVGEVRDRAHVFVNEHRLGVLSRDHHERALPVGPGKGELALLVEDQGRVDYGPRIGESKGLIGRLEINGQAVHRWSILPLELDDISLVAEALCAREREATPLIGPVFASGTFDLDDAEDLFLDTRTWGKGVAWVNGFCLGRYWSRGPQHTLYVPAPVVHPGENQIVVFELDAIADARAAFVARPDLGHTEF